MKTKLQSLFVALMLLAGVHQVAAQMTQFFRISGPAATSITAFRTDGTLVWSNALAGTNYTVQTLASLAGGSNWTDYVQLPVTTTFNTNLLVAFNPPAGMVLIPAGSFTMGNLVINGSTRTNDPDITDANPTNIYVSAFYMDVNLVSSNQWAAVYSYATNHGYSIENAGMSKAPNHPVQTVDWYDCVKWSNARSQQAGLKPIYYTDAGFMHVFTNGDNGTTVYANWATNGYRLPTEAEWEKAARGGLTGNRFPWGNTISENQANYYSFPYFDGGYVYDLGPYYGPNTNFVAGGQPYTSPVGSFAANGYGLYDMAGNVFEWCWDYYATPYGQPTTTNPTGPVGPLSSHVLRGGNWGPFAYLARCANRYYHSTGDYDNTVGFRCVRGP